MFAAIIGIALTSALSANQMTRWGWRAAFLAGCTLIPFLYFMRRSLEETPEFLARTSRPRVADLVREVFANWRLVSLGMMMATMTTVSFYLITTYTPTFGSTVLHLAPTGILVVTLCVGALNFIVLPLSGALSDRIGRPPILIGCALTALITAYPALWW